MALFTGAFFVAQVSLIIVAKPFYAIFCTSCVPYHENPRIIVVRSWRMLNMVEYSLRWWNKSGEIKEKKTLKIQVKWQRATLELKRFVSGVAKNS